MLVSELPLLALANLCIGLILGAILYRGDFCMAGILRDFFLFKDLSLLRPLFLAVILVLFFILLARWAGFLSVAPPPMFGSASLLGIFGGLLFGLGMVLAGGCVISTLYKMGGGNLTNLIGFTGIVGGSLLYAEIHPQVRQLADLVQVTEHITLSQWSPLTGTILGWLIVGASVPFFLTWQRQGKMTVNAAAEGYLQPCLVALLFALLNLAAYGLSGWPIGITTAYAKLGAFLEYFLAPGHVENLQYFQKPSFTVHTAAGSLQGGAAPRVDLIFFTQMALLVGVVAGSFLSALSLREFRWNSFPPLRQGLAAFAGGVLMALGARSASGCNVWFLLSGLPLLSFQAFLFLPGLLAGTWLGVRLLPKIILR